MTNTWTDVAYDEAWEEAQKRIDSIRAVRKIDKYAYDPVGYCHDVLGETITDDVQTVMRSVVDNPVTIARSCNGPGKSHGAGRIAVWFYRVFEDAKVFLTAAPPAENLKHILWGEVQSAVRHHPHLFEDDRLLATSIMRHKQSFITGVAIPTSGTIEAREAKFSGKHAPHLLFIVDEGDAVPDEVYRGIESCMSGGFARLLIMFNPKAQFGPVYQKEKNGEANVVHLSAFSHPNVVTGDDLIPGAVDRGITVRRINEWTRPLAPDEKRDAECFEVPDFLVGTTTKAPNGVLYPTLPAGVRKILDPAFSYMVLGEYPAKSEHQLISRAWIDNARSRWDAYVAIHGEIPPAGVEPVLGIDIAELGTDPNVACLRYGGFVAKLQTWNGIDVDDSARRSLKVYKNYSCKIAMIDAIGVGSAVAPSMSRLGKKEGVIAMGVKVSSKPSPIIEAEQGEFYQLRDQLWWAVREWLRVDPGAMLPNDPLLVEELITPTYSESPDTGKIHITKKDKIRHLIKRSPDRADALCLTFTPLERAKVIKLDI